MQQEAQEKETRGYLYAAVEHNLITRLDHKTKLQRAQDDKGAQTQWQAGLKVYQQVIAGTWQFV